MKLANMKAGVILLFITIWAAGISALFADAAGTPPVVSETLQVAAYRAMVHLQALQLQQAQIAAQMPDAQKAFESAQAALLGACGSDFQMDPEALKQERFVCEAKPKVLKPDAQSEQPSSERR